MTSTDIARPVGYTSFEELRVDAPATADELIGILTTEAADRLRTVAGFVSARIHRSLDGTVVVSRFEWQSARHLDDFCRDGLDGSPLATLAKRPGVLDATSFGGTPLPGIEGPAAKEAPGILSVATRYVPDRQSAHALGALLQDSGGWKRHHPGFVSASPYVSLDGTTYVNYPQWVDEESFQAYMANPRNAAGQDAIAALEAAPPRIVMCTLVAQIDAAPATTGTYSTGALAGDEVSALDQVRLFEKKYDPTTTDVIRRLPVEPGWRCLELGAGAGSMAYWLAERVPEGLVVAVDQDTRYLDPARAPHLTVRKGDVERQEFPDGSFDLILARALFEHLKDPDEMLRRAVRWLAPGGWLVVEDFYFLPGADASTAVSRSLVAAYVRHMRGRGADLSWGRRLPASLARAGLASVGSRITPAGPGQSEVDDELIGLRMRQEGHALVDSGRVSAEELTEFLSLLGTAEGRDLTTLLVSAWGRKEN